MNFEKGPMSGRIFRASGKIPSLEEATNTPASGPPEERISFCRDVPPFDADLSSCQHPLSFLPGSPSFLWIRSDLRSPPRAAVDSLLSERFGDRLRAMRPKVAAVEREKARGEILATMVPKTTLTCVVRWRDLCFVSSTSPSRALLSFLSHAAGRLEPWMEYSPSGFQTLCTKAASRGARGELNEFTLERVSAKVGKGRMSGQFSSVAESMSTAMRTEDVVFESIAVSSTRRGSFVEVSFDPEGPFRFQVPDSPGGIPSDRAERRFEDILGAATDIHEELQHLVRSA